MWSKTIVGLVACAVLCLLGLAGYCAPSAGLRQLIGKGSDRAAPLGAARAASESDEEPARGVPSGAAAAAPNIPRRHGRAKLKSTLERARAAVAGLKSVDLGAVRGSVDAAEEQTSAQQALRLAEEADRHLRFDDAAAQYTRAVDLADQELGTGPATWLQRVQVGVAAGSFWHRHGHFEKGLACVNATQSRAHKDDELSGQETIALASLKELRGNILREISQFEDAQLSYAQARSLLEAVAAPAAQEALALLEGEVGWALYREARLAEAHGHLQKAIVLLPAAGSARRTRFSARLAAVEHDEGRVEEALEGYVGALEKEMNKGKPEAVATETYETLQDMSVAVGTLESPEHAVGDITATIASQQDLLAAEATVNAHVQDKALMMSLATSLQLGSEFLQKSDHQDQLKALRWVEQALEIQRNCTGRSDDISNVEVLNTRANIELGLHRTSAAVATLSEALRIAEAANQTRSATVAALYFNFGAVLHRTGRFEEAVGMYRKCLALEQQLGASNPLDVALANNNIAVSLHKMGKWEEALQFAEAAVALAVELPEDNSDSRLFRKTLGEINKKLHAQVA